MEKTTRSFCRVLISAAIFFGWQEQAGALQLQVSYALDDTGFFAAHPAAEAAVEAAARDISALLSTSLTPVTGGSQKDFTGTSGSSSVTFQWGLSLNDPEQPTRPLVFNQAATP